MTFRIETQISDLEGAWAILKNVQSASPNPLGTQWTRPQLLDSIQIGHCFSALNEMSLVGFALFQDRTIANELQLIAVNPDRQRQGVAHQLLQEAIRSTQNNKEIWLEVSERNGPARSLYESLSFVQVGTRPKYYPDGSSALLYSRR